MIIRLKFWWLKTTNKRKLVWLALSVYKALYEEQKRNNRIVLTTSDYKPIRQLIIP